MSPAELEREGAPQPAVGIGILGAAHIAHKNARALNQAANARVVAVGSRDAVRAAALLERCGVEGAAAYGSYEEVLADPRVQAVYIPLPSALHLPWVRAAAAAGKHLLLEKPAAVNAQELQAILEACGAAGVQLMDGTMWMHNPRAARMAAMLQDAAQPLGRVQEVVACFTFLGNEEFWRGNVRISGTDPLGALGDLGWYCVRAILFAFGWEPPLAVAADAGPVFSDSGIPLHIGATLTFAGGRRGHFECGFDQPRREHLRISGTAGSMQLDDFVIPKAADRCSFLLNTADGEKQEEVQVALEKPQEVLMWEAFASLAQRCTAGRVGPDAFWPRVLELTQRVLFAVERSAREGCREVALASV